MGILTGELHKLVFGGSLCASEQWACSIHMMTAGVETEDDAAAIALMVAPIYDWFGRQASHINQQARLEWIKLNKINKPDGLYADAGSANTLYPGTVGLPAPANISGPPQITQVISFNTDIARGRGSKGRIYPPTVSGDSGGSFVETNGLTNLGRTLEMADSGQELLAELNNVVGNLTCVVWSQIGQVGRAIETVRVGRIVDTQRRRRNNLNESYVSATAPV